MNKKDYDRKFMAENCITVRLQLNKKNDADIIAKLNEQTNKNGYLKALIRKENEMTLGELIQVTDLTETMINVYKDGEKIEINWDSDNDYPVKRIYGGNTYEMNVEI